MRYQRDRPGFTLVELIIVMAIIALLIGIAVPAMKGVSRRARTAQCLSNMRNLERAHWSYMSDHRSRMIDAGLPHHSLGNTDVAWINTLQEYYETEGTVRSPLDESPHFAIKDGGKGEPVPGTEDVFRQTSYGLNNYLTQFSPTLSLEGWRHDRLSKVKNPARTVHFVMMVFTDDNGFCGADHIHVENWGPDKPGGAASQMQINAVSGPKAEWSSRANYGFLDGHVETLNFADVYANADVNQLDPEVSWKHSHDGAGEP